MEIFNSRGDLIYSHDRDGEQPQQVIEQHYINDLVWMMTKVVEEGTGRRAQLDGVKVAGKTGTTNDYKDAWFCGYTGNFVGVVWYGNDDDQSMARMTGGTLPAQTWHEIMQYAHSGVDLKPLSGFPLSADQGPTAQLTSEGGDQAPKRREQLSKKSSEALGAIEILIKSTADRHVQLDLPTGPARHDHFAEIPGRRSPIIELH